LVDFVYKDRRFVLGERLSDFRVRMLGGYLWK